MATSPPCEGEPVGIYELLDPEKGYVFIIMQNLKDLLKTVSTKKPTLNFFSNQKWSQQCMLKSEMKSTVYAKNPWICAKVKNSRIRARLYIHKIWKTSLKQCMLKTNIKVFGKSENMPIIFLEYVQKRDIAVYYLLDLLNHPTQFG